LEELVGLVNMELDSSYDVLKERLDAIDAELNDVEIRLSCTTLLRQTSLASMT